MDGHAFRGAELMKKYEWVLPEMAQNQRLEQYLAQALPLFPAHEIRDIVKRRDVKLDGQRIHRDAQLNPGEKIQIFTAYEPELPTIYEDDKILLINKPAGISCMDDGRGGLTVESLLNERAKGIYRPRLCHRLDHVTSGLLLLAKDDESEECLLRAFKERTLKKVYQCLVRGEMRPAAALREAYLIKDEMAARVRVITHATPGALPIATEYETLSFDGRLSRLRVTLHTGRTHQIRAHMAFLAHPILGDDKYGDRSLNKQMRVNGLKLCAQELTMNAGGCLDYLDGKTFSITPPF